MVSLRLKAALFLIYASTGTGSTAVVLRGAQAIAVVSAVEDGKALIAPGRGDGFRDYDVVVRGESSKIIKVALSPHVDVTRSSKGGSIEYEIDAETGKILKRVRGE